MHHLETIVRNLKNKDKVDAVFVTGSHGTADQKDYSDIDLIVLLKENINNIRSVFTWIDGKFADIFFFDHADLMRIESEKEVEANEMDAVFVYWLKKAAILFDKSGKLSKLAIMVRNNKTDQAFVSTEKQRDVWQKINYNYIANKRYYDSHDPLYHEALEMRLLYSVIEVMTGYLALRGIPWRGEKDAVKYIRKSDPGYYDIFESYTKARNLDERFKLYDSLVKNVFPENYRLWGAKDVITMFKDQTVAGEDTAASQYWDYLVSGDEK